MIGCRSGEEAQIKIRQALSRQGSRTGASCENHRFVDQVIASLRDTPNVDLMSGPDVVPFYERFRMQPVGGMVLRQVDALRTLLEG